MIGCLIPCRLDLPIGNDMKRNLFLCLAFEQQKEHQQSTQLGLRMSPRYQTFFG
jgi:hypothetical protein